jgi:hypothetical protein
MTINEWAKKIKHECYEASGDHWSPSSFSIADCEECIKAIRAEALKDAADRAVVYAMTRTAVWPEELSAAILAGEAKDA